MIVIGLMSGTSADGVDAAIVELHGAWPDLRWRLIHHLTLPYATTLRHEILANCDPRTGTVDRICTLHVVIGRAFADAAIATVQAAGLSLSQVDLIGSHGQTIWHAPQGDPPATLQIGCAATIAERCGVSVVSDFRSRDVAAGGQGAPLVAAVDLLLLTHPTRTRAAQNIGGIGNVTFLPPTSPAAGRQSDREAFAFDTGPGNMLIDAAVAHQSDGALHYDRGGLIAAQGQVHQTLLAELLDDPFFRQTPPKTTGREQYGAAAFERIRLRASQLGVTQTDLVATLTALTAESIAAAYRDFLPQPLDEVLVSGGGAHNPTLMRMLSERLVPASVITSDTIGLPSDAKEALAFAVLAYETWHGRPGNLPAATGAARPVVLGSITPAGPKTQDPRPKIQGDKEIGAAEPQAEDPRPKTQDPNSETQSVGNEPPATSHQPPATTEPDSQPSSIVHRPSSTELRNPASAQIDMLPTLEMLRVINHEDATVPAAVERELPQIARAVDEVAARLRAGGRLIYVGAGTSGRLGALDAAECPPTYSTPPGLVIALIAGGPQALTGAVEGAEDDMQAGAVSVTALGITAQDALVGIAASGTTPFVIGALRTAEAIGALTISLACNHPSPIAEIAEIAIAPVVGPEVVTGSTRMKAGTAQKLVLNMLSTGVMIRLGKTYGNLMVDLQATNTKLRRRACRIVSEATGLDLGAAESLLAQCDGEVKVAIVAALTGQSPGVCRRQLTAAGGVVREALSSQ